MHAFGEQYESRGIKIKKYTLFYKANKVPTYIVMDAITEYPETNNGIEQFQNGFMIT